MSRRVLIFIVISVLFNPLMAQSGLYSKNYDLAQKLYEKDFIELVLNKDVLTNEEKEAFMLAIYYKCSIQEVSHKEMIKVIEIFSPAGKISSNGQEALETQFYKIINDIDKSMHTKDFSYLSDLVDLPF